MIRLSRYAPIIPMILALLILPRCGNDGPTKPHPPTPAKVTITPQSPSSSSAGQTSTRDASVRDESGAKIAEAVSDRTALVALYNATNGPNWTNKENWLSDAPMGQWHGVTTGQNGRVIRLVLERNNLQGPIPAELGSLDELDRLVFGNNKLIGAIPPELGNLSNLGTLWLADNNLSGTIPDELGKLVRVWQMSFRDNPGLSGSLPLTFTNLASLEYFYLSRTNVCAPADPEIAVWLSTIEEHDVVSCADLEAEIAKAVSDRAALVALYNATNGPNWTNKENWLSDAPMGQWHGVTTGQYGRVTRLMFTQNNLTGPIPAELGSLDELRSLNVVDNNLNGPIPPELGNLSKLAFLWMPYNDLSGAIPDELGRLVNLTEIGFQANPGLSGSLPLTFTNLTSLVRLFLGGTNVCVPTNPDIQAWLSTIEDHDVTTICSDLDIEALTVLFNATGGSNWTNKENWLSEAPLNDWYGVATDEIGRVAGLDLPNNNLRGVFPPEMADLASLKNLNMSLNGGLGGPLPLRLGELSLETLNLEGTHVCATRDAGFQEWLNSIPNRSVVDCAELDTEALVALVGLYTSTGGKNWTNRENWLSQAPLAAWHGVTVDAEGRVTGLDLSDNNLGGSLPSSLSRLADLKVLDVSNNAGLTGPLPQSITGISLESLSLGGTDLCVPTGDGYGTWLQGLQDASGVMACSNVNPDREVLVTLYNETNGPNWEENTNWLSTKPLDEWFGVSTDASGRVTVLSLHRNKLLGIVPEALGRLNELQILQLGFNELSGPIPPELGDLRNLRELGIEFCWLSGTIPSELGKLTRLETLSLWGNGSTLTGPLPRELGFLANLMTLSLSGNGFTGRIPPEMGQLDRLTDVDLSWNNLTGPIPGELGRLARLSSLLLAGNELNGPLPPELGRLSELVRLDLSRNRIAGKLPEELERLSSLQVLNLANNVLQGSIPGELGRMTALETLDLSHNELAGSVPRGLGRLTALRELVLAGNTGLYGPLPGEITNLSLETLMLWDTGVCAPRDSGFQAWLRSVQNSRVLLCPMPIRATTYLTQATQSLDHPVPLVAGEDAFLRVFVRAGEGTDITMPPVRATFYQAGNAVYTADISGEDFDIPVAFDEDELAGSANVRVPGSVVMPGLEAVIEIDPDETLGPSSGVAGRIPETGRMPLDVRQLPTLDLTLVPFLWADGPELAVLSVVDGLTPESELMRLTHDLLPVGDFRLTVHAPVWTSVDPISDNVDTMSPELEALYAIEGGKGYYMGIFRAMGSSGLRGIAYGIPSYISFSILDPNVIAHELGHNLNLFHAPCGGALGPDPYFPYGDGTIGTSGFDPERGTLVSPETADLMSYCEPQWISDYSFTRALNHRMALGASVPRAPAAAVRGLLLWGGLDEAGDVFLEPAFAVEAPPVLPSARGPYTIAGERDDGGELFTLSFDIPEYVDAEGGGSFAFILPVGANWPESLERVTITGPGGFDSIGDEEDGHYALMLDRATGEVRGILRDWPDPANPRVAGRRLPPEPGLEITTSGGIPDPESW